jgi:hypothetical protein
MHTSVFPALTSYHATFARPELLEYFAAERVGKKSPLLGVQILTRATDRADLWKADATAIHELREYPQ